ncbi:hypothetical protein MSG28_006603 [Choristoneura fumiferana]|uniref:Uncharacterized protein n=1 Tax=Choristoneura fumiferana TaxID=7141 RepID=A0ACC0JFF2_CHOFU|nr:hypothetical protein MSG28_006603 [Choristoneura fumiferana]
MLDRKYFYTTDFKFWGLLPRAKRRYKLLSLLTTFPFRGDPTLKIKILDEALEENHPDRCQVIKEESRLAGTISNICDEAEICARGQLIKQPDGTVVINPNFYGLTGSEAKQLKSYLHIRPSQQRWNSNLLSRQDYNYSMDFLDSIDQDIPSGCWNLSLEQGGSVAYLKSLYWPEVPNLSTNAVNVEDAEMTECDDEKVVTMMDVLQEQQEFEEDANAVLGASDDKNCTYSKGYIKRQALYACLTCCSEAKEDPSKRAGVCLACSLTCHENHDLIELYTKRNFCCDCGNPKFNHPCQYTSKEKDLNNENKYNQNFSGLYCTCHRPYPDPDGVEEEMIQCIICEDWLHESHLEATVPSSDAYAEMICKGCMEKNDFLHDYGTYAVNGDADINMNDSDISICNGDTSKLNGVDEAEKEPANGEEVANMTVEESIAGGEEGAGNSNGEVTDNAVPTESENPSLTNDEQIEPKIGDPESSNINEEEFEDKLKESTEETAVENETNEQNTTDNEGTEKVEDAEKDPEEQNITDTESTEKVEDESQLNETGSKEQLSEDNSDVAATIDTENTTNVTTNDAEGETENKEVQEESSVSTKLSGDNDTNTEEAADQVNKDETEPKTNETETITNKEDIDEMPNEQPVNSQENEKDSAASNINDSIEKDTEMDESTKVEVNTSTTEDQTKENKRKLSTEDADDKVDVISVKKPKLEGSKCTRLRNERKVFKGATFWPSNFRQKLCTCNECIVMYQDLSVLFLIDPEDTVSAYETLGKEKTDGTASTQYEKGLEALSSLGRIQQINALTEYNKMRDKLLDFLKSFKDRKEVVKEDDIKAFFAGMKPKREPDGVYFCK